MCFVNGFVSPDSSPVQIGECSFGVLPCGVLHQDRIGDNFETFPLAVPTILCVPAPDPSAALGNLSSCEDLEAQFVCNNFHKNNSHTVKRLIRGYHLQTMFEKLDAAATKMESFVCVGLDPTPEHVPINDILAFNCAIIDATKDVVSAFKPQFAYYEAMGIEGWKILEKTIQHIRDVAPDHVIVGDGKRGDISTTATAYATAMFEVWDVDIATIYAYQGSDAVEPFLQYPGKGVYIVCRTSNPSARDIQDLVVDGSDQRDQVFNRVAEMAEKWIHTEKVGLVVGATYPDDLRALRSKHPDPHFLIPGVGAQGGVAEDTARAGANERGGGFIVNSSRGIIYASSNPESFDIAAHEAAELLKTQLNDALKHNGHTAQTLTIE